MTIMYRACDGVYFRTKEVCMDYEKNMYLKKMLKAQTEYQKFKSEVHKEVVKKYEDIKKVSEHAYKNKLMKDYNLKQKAVNEEYMQRRILYKRNLKKSCIRLREYKEKFLHEVAEYKRKRTE